MKALEATVLADIEAPLPPGTDWAWWWQVGEMLWVALLLLALGWWLVRRTYRPWRLARQLRALAAQAGAQEGVQPGEDECVAQAQVWRLYAWGQRWQKALPTTFEALPDLAQFNAALNQAAFSAQPVSRETFWALLAQAQTLLSQTQQAGWKRRLGGTRWTR